MARKALGKELLRARVPPWVIVWWHAQALRYGFSFGDGPALGEFWEAIARGDFEIVCTSQNNCATVIQEGKAEEVEPETTSEERRMKAITLKKLVEDCHFDIAATPEELFQVFERCQEASKITGTPIQYVPGMYVRSGNICVVYATDDVHVWKSAWATDSDGGRYTKVSEPRGAAPQMVIETFGYSDASTPFHGLSGSPGIGSATDLDCVVSLAFGRWISVSSRMSA